MARGGKREGAGRRQGTRSQKTVRLLERVAAQGITPLEYMLEVLRDDSAARSERLDAAKSAAPYIHSKMPTALVTPPAPGGPVTQDDLSILDRYFGGLHDEHDEADAE